MHLLTSIQKNFFKFIKTYCWIGLALVSCKTNVQQGASSSMETVSYPEKNVSLSAKVASELAQNIKKTVNVELADGLDLSLWASDTLVQAPIAISIDEKGRIYYTKANRQHNSEFDIRGHRHWITASISFQTIEDRRKFLRETFREGSEESERVLKDLNKDGILDWRDLTVEKEQIWVVEDRANTGLADWTQLYLEDFHEEITDVANGLEAHNGEVFICVGPDMWRTKDSDNNGVADQRASISRGYAIHIGFSGHGMSGAKIGPDGRIWWGIGDIGMNVVDKEGKQWAYPNQGVIVRSELDGSNFEVYSAGLRNTHEFVFDQFGNLISEDNDGDHRGERERLVHLINGSDCGWRTNWQVGKYSDPKNNRYKVWMEEKLHLPHWEGQAAYILPPISNYVNGPTGMVYNPGTALSEEWYNHFFVAEFRGSPTNSPIHAFTLKPKGASFELDSTQIVVQGLLPTGLDFGPDGALYFADWIDGWSPNKGGRIWKLDIPGEVNSAIRKETKAFLEADFSEKNEGELAKLLAHQDMRVRQKAQFTLVERGTKGLDTFLNTARGSKNQLARIHSLWGIGQLARQNPDYAKYFLDFLEDKDSEIITQSAKMIGDVRFKEASNGLISLLKHPSPRVQLYATEALGRTQDAQGSEGIIEMLIANNDQDIWLRHAGAIALARIGKAEELANLNTHPSQALKLAVVVALRRMKSPFVSKFLGDKDELVVAEAARAINDDLSIEEALPALADLLKNTTSANEVILRRAINANLRVGTEKNIKILSDYASDKAHPEAMRAEALDALSTWGELSVFDRVDGRYRGEIKREEAPVRTIVQSIVPDLLNENNQDMQVAAAKSVARLQIKNSEERLFNLIKNSASSEARKAALETLYALESQFLDEGLSIALADQDKALRSVALEILPQSKLEEEVAVSLLEKVLERGEIIEKQAALSALGNYKGEKAIQVLERSLDTFIAGNLAPAIQLEVIEAVENQKANNLMAKLNEYQEALPKDDPLALYKVALEGGNAREGRQVFYNHEAAQCIRCHAVFEVGGNAGPGLAGVGSRLSPEKLLESMVAPSASLAPGYGMVSLKMPDDEVVTGIVMEENDSQIKLKIGKAEIREINKNDVLERRDIPSSMPAMGNVLTKREIRNLVAFLKTLKEELE